MKPATAGSEIDRFSRGHRRRPPASATLYELRSSRRERRKESEREKTGTRPSFLASPTAHTHARPRVATTHRHVRHGGLRAAPRRETLHTRVHIRRFLADRASATYREISRRRDDGGRARASRRRVGGPTR